MPSIFEYFLVFHFISGMMSVCLSMVLFCESLEAHCLGRKGVIVGFIKQPWVHMSMMSDDIVPNILM